MGQPAKPPGDSPLARTLRQQRELLGLKIREVAEAAGITESHLSRLERGERGLREDTAIRLAQTLKLSPARVKKLAGILDDEDLERYARFPSFRQAVTNDQNLTAAQKRHFLELYALLVPASESDSSSSSGKTPPSPERT